MKTQIKSLVLVLSILTLSFSGACARNTSNSESSSTPVNAKTTIPSMSATISSLDDVLKKIKAGYNNEIDIQVINKTDIDSENILVEYNVKAYNEFLLYNIKTGKYDILARDAKLLKAENRNHFVFEIIGDWNEGGFLSFPYIEEYIRKAVIGDGQDAFNIAHISEFYELSRSVKGGIKDSDKLSAINATFDSLEFMFKPADGAAGRAFYAAASYIPQTVTSYDESTGQLTVELDKCQLDSAIQTDFNVKTADNAYISTYKVHQKGDSIYIIVTLKAVAAGYAMRSGKVPGDQSFDGYPYLKVKFTNKDTMTQNQYYKG